MTTQPSPSAACSRAASHEAMSMTCSECGYQPGPSTSAACECSGDDEFCERCHPGLEPRVFCAGCGRAIFRRSSDNEWAHVSTHDRACPPSVAEPREAGQ